MRLVFLVPLITALSVTISFSNLTQTANGADREVKIEEQLTQMERDWAAAYIKREPAVISRILADDYIGIDGRGIITNKAQEIEEATPPPTGTPLPTRQIVADTVTDMKVRLYDKAAVVIGRTIEKVVSNGKEFEVQYRRTTVYVQRHGRWQCVSFHGSRLIEATIRKEKYDLDN